MQNLDDPKVVTFKTIDGRFGLDEAGEATLDADDRHLRRQQQHAGAQGRHRRRDHHRLLGDAAGRGDRPRQGHADLRPADRNPHRRRNDPRQRRVGQRARQARHLHQRRLGHLHAAGRTRHRNGAGRRRARGRSRNDATPRRCSASSRFSRCRRRRRRNVGERLFSGFQAQSKDPIEVDRRPSKSTRRASSASRCSAAASPSGAATRRSRPRRSSSIRRCRRRPRPTPSPASRRPARSGSIRATRRSPATNAVVDMKSQTITVSGGVVLTQGTNVLTGTRLVVNLATGRRAASEGSRSAACSRRASQSAAAPGN